MHVNEGFSNEKHLEVTFDLEVGRWQLTIEIKIFQKKTSRNYEKPF